MFTIKEFFPNTFLVENNFFDDSRGRFCKKLTKNLLESIGFKFDLFEEFYTKSFNGVIRGMHFTLPPYDQTKIVYCISGSVMDVILDLRPGANYGNFQKFILDSAKPSLLIIPKGVAHGFKSLSDDSILVYKTDSEYNLNFDSGLYYNSFGCDWGIEDPVISERDQGLIKFEDFVSPFIYD
jgi:dTDP-4-dehydrorhamnose 3,5-epimerase